MSEGSKKDSLCSFERIKSFLINILQHLMESCMQGRQHQHFQSLHDFSGSTHVGAPTHLLDALKAMNKPDEE
ncbi:hypothetical protein DNTS_025903 [Danionella cerebrum]|uniref:Uncharacterized protein n=1 Tax=Danionella cerebrum TaxID=2873325 RepID=A0A553MWV2_9TELE|nr:hypothetical protein DNTS_025903 [Danionella translucida]